MSTNRSRPETWDADINRSVEFYNDWFLNFAPEAYRAERVAAAISVQGMLASTNYLLDITPRQLRSRPEILAALRMSTAPPIDAVIMPRGAASNDLPLLVEAKSAGDFANTNKRRKEEATKLEQLRRQYGDKVQFVLFLCGYFDRRYLQYEAAEGIDWVWEHRVGDFEEFGL